MTRVKIGQLKTNISPLIRKPRPFFNYLQREKNLANFLGLEKSEVRAYLKEADEITRTMLKLTQEAKLGTMLSPLRGPIIHVCTRVLKPAIMVETGVASGSSTYYILQAMKSNGRGTLYSIDLPNVGKGALIPEGKEVGWLVPARLKCGWILILGRSQNELPPLVKKLKSIDVFLHNSEHTYKNMMLEYETVWPHLREGGLLLSDDVHKNRAFCDFIRKRKPKRWVAFDGLGAIVK